MAADDDDDEDGSDKSIPVDDRGGGGYGRRGNGDEIVGGRSEDAEGSDVAVIAAE